MMLRFMTHELIYIMVGSGCLKVNEPPNDQNKKKDLLFFIAVAEKRNERTSMIKQKP
jgi:hypothetical protein